VGQPERPSRDAGSSAMSSTTSVPVTDGGVVVEAAAMQVPLQRNNGKRRSDPRTVFTEATSARPAPRVPRPPGGLLPDAAPARQPPPIAR